jgi:hypothetical protein
MKDTRYHDYETPDTNCPGCGKDINGALASRVQSPPPKPGDLSVCAYCAVAGVFTDDLTVRALTADEFEALPVQAKMDISRATGAVMARREMEGLQ